MIIVAQSQRLSLRISFVLLYRPHGNPASFSDWESLRRTMRTNAKQTPAQRKAGDEPRPHCNPNAYLEGGRSFIPKYDNLIQKTRKRFATLTTNKDANIQAKYNVVLDETFERGAESPLTNLECERLLGYPDEHTRWKLDRRGAKVAVSFAARRKMLGNTFMVDQIVFMLWPLMLACRASDTPVKKYFSSQSAQRHGPEVSFPRVFHK